MPRMRLSTYLIAAVGVAVAAAVCIVAVAAVVLHDPDVGLLVLATLMIGVGCVAGIGLLLDTHCQKYDRAFLLGYRMRDWDDYSEPEPVQLRLIDLDA